MACLTLQQNNTDIKYYEMDVFQFYVHRIDRNVPCHIYKVNIYIAW